MFTTRLPSGIVTKMVTMTHGYNVVTPRYHMITITANFPPHRFSIIASSTGVCWSLLRGPERCRCVVGGIWSPYRTPRSDSGHSVTSLLHCYIHVTMGHGYNLVTSRYHMVTITASFPPHPVLTMVAMGMLAVDEG